MTRRGKGLAALGVPVLYDADIGHIPPPIQCMNGALGTVEFVGGKAAVWQKRID